MAELTYREAVAAGIAQEMERDETVVFLGEDIAKAGGVFKATVGLYDKFGPDRVRDTPISEQAILGAAMGAAMTGLRPIAEIMFSDFLAVCWDIVSNQIAKGRYMTDGQVSMPLVIRTANGGVVPVSGRSIPECRELVYDDPRVKSGGTVIARGRQRPSGRRHRDPDPVMFFEQKSLYATKGEVPDGEHVEEMGKARVVRDGDDVTIVALAAMVPRAVEAADRLQAEENFHGVVDPKGLVPLDTTTIFNEIGKTGRLVTVEKSAPMRCWGQSFIDEVAEERFWDLDMPILGSTTPYPLPSSEELEDIALPSVARIFETVRNEVDQMDVLMPQLEGDGRRACPRFGTRRWVTLSKTASCCSRLVPTKLRWKSLRPSPAC